MGRYGNQEGHFMSKQAKAANYSPEQEAMLRAASPLNLESAKSLADEMGKSYRSVIAKVKSMGLPYESKPTPKKRPGGATKSEAVAAIATALDLEASELDGLEKATGLALATILRALGDSK
jgi:hypothetical protein